MHTKIPLRVLAVLVSVFMSISPLFAQKDSTSSVSLSVTADVVSSYIWRGQDLGHKFSLQPGISATWKDFTIGAWGAYRFKGDGVDEMDIYLTKTIGPVSMAIWDYWSYSKVYPSNYLDYSRETTSHLLEAQVLISGGEKLPLNLLVSYFFYGSDPSNSIYLELQYALAIKKSELLFFTGYQPKGTYYAPKAGFVNVGATFRQPLHISEAFTPALLLSLIANPYTKNFHFVVGLSI